MTCQFWEIAVPVSCSKPNKRSQFAPQNKYFFKMGRAKYFCFLVKPQIGCMVIALIETLWYLLNLYLCFSILFVGLKKHVLRIDYYTETSINLGKQKQKFQTCLVLTVGVNNFLNFLFFR
jgi:hypothetical protein